MVLNCGVGEDSFFWGGVFYFILFHYYYYYFFPWTTRWSNQSILNEISPGCWLEGLMLKLKLQYFGHLIWADSLGNTLILGKIEGRRKRRQQSIRLLNGITDWMDMSLIKLQELCTSVSLFLDSVGEGEGELFQENSIKTCILSRVKQITIPGWMHETSAQAWCTGKTQRRGGRWEGGSEWGTHVNPWPIHVNVWQKPLQYCKLISLQLIKIHEKKK